MSSNREVGTDALLRGVGRSVLRCVSTNIDRGVRRSDVSSPVVTFASDIVLGQLEDGEASDSKVPSLEVVPRDGLTSEDHVLCHKTSRVGQPVRASDLREVVVGGREFRQRLKNVPSTECALSRRNGSVQTSSANLERGERRRDVVRVVVPARVEGLVREDYFSINGVTWRIVAFDYFYGIGYPKYLR